MLFYLIHVYNIKLNYVTLFSNYNCLFSYEYLKDFLVKFCIA